MSASSATKSPSKDDHFAGVLYRAFLMRNKMRASRVLMPEGRPRAAVNRRELLMGILIWLIVGGICGWLASMIMRTDGQQGIVLNVIVGIVGAAIAGFIFGGAASLNNGITVQTFLYSLLGAVVLLAIVNLVRRGSVR